MQLERSESAREWRIALYKSSQQVSSVSDFPDFLLFFLLWRLKTKSKHLKSSQECYLSGQNTTCFVLIVINSVLLNLSYVCNLFEIFVENKIGINHHQCCTAMNEMHSWRSSLTLPAKFLFSLLWVEELVANHGGKVVPLLHRKSLKGTIGTLGEDVVCSVLRDCTLSNASEPGQASTRI